MIGSVWQKWDLHLHGPSTHQNNQYGKLTIDEFVQKVVDSKLSLIGVTNYFFFADNELEDIRASIRARGENIIILGNIEFRIVQPNKDGEWINVHCIFSDKLSSDQINNVLSTLPIINTTASGKVIYCSNRSFTDSSINISEALVDFNKLVDHLGAHLKFGFDFLIAACPNGYGGFRPNVKEGRSLALAFEIEKRCQIVLGRSQDREFFLKENRYDGAKPKPVFVGSDAHEIGSIGVNYSWVKAKPTFEGLRQALIEPEDRVQQTDDFTENKYIKPRFKSISIGGTIFPGQAIQFSPETIPLNPNMVAIIGGRGTGKSLFLDAMYSMFNHRLLSHYARKVKVENLSITLNQGDDTEFTFDYE